MIQKVVLKKGPKNGLNIVQKRYENNSPRTNGPVHIVPYALFSGRNSQLLIFISISEKTEKVNVVT